MARMARTAWHLCSDARTHTERTARSTLNRSPMSYFRLIVYAVMRVLRTVVKTFREEMAARPFHSEQTTNMIASAG